MLESFSIQAVKIIDDAKALAIKLDSNVVGTEHLLLSMYEMKDSICRFLLEEKNITYDDLFNTLDNITVIHKNDTDKIIFTSKVYEIIHNAEKIAEEVGSDYVYDEHLFYSLLEYDSCVATEMLNELELDIESMKLDIEDIYNFYKDDNDSPYPFLKNLSSSNTIHPFISRSNFIERINYILDKKQKNNPLLIGSAGVGKTAIIEGLSKIRTVETIYQLDLGGIVAGTKYRGELEDKIVKVMNFIKETKSILFIDEIHNIVGAGSNDGSLDVANILKPYLSRADISVIGATTLDEYFRFIDKDKALMRRFQTIFIDEPSINETKLILSGIKKSYEEYHNFTVDDNIINKIIEKTNIYMPNRAFPDKAIDVLDELGSRLKYTNDIESTLDQIIYDQTNIKVVSVDILKKLKLNYNELKIYYLRFIERVYSYPNIFKCFVEKNFNVNDLIEDLSKVFNFKKEMYLEINLDYYTDSSMISNLIGSSKGYVGYDQGGILSEHIIKYPICLVYFKNYQNVHSSIRNMIDKIMKENMFIDSKGRSINLSNTMFIVDYVDNSSTIGFNKIKSTKKHLILRSLKNKNSNLDIYCHIIKKYNINVDNINNLTNEEIEAYIYQQILNLNSK